MVKRETLKQTDHDKVIGTLKTTYEKQYPKVWSNPDGEKNMNIKDFEDLYPDILVANEQNILLFIEEVETEDTITEEHAKEQWIPYSKVRTQFFIRVPLNSQAVAKKVLVDLNITATVRCYQITNSQVTLMGC